ncbi:MAG: hypothetical protein WAL95_12080 [Candidatus Acidiferrales bacterium]
MRRHTLLFVIGLSFMSTSMLAGQARAQNASAHPENAMGNATAQSTTANAAATTPHNPTTTTPATPAPPAKKVWTNEDMGAVHKDPAISTFSSKPNKPANSKPVAAKPKSKSAGQYQAQIANLQAKLPPLDQQISELQAGLNGETVNSTRHYNGVKPDDWRDQLARLQKQRDAITAQISVLQDQARHNGVPDNQIP